MGAGVSGRFVSGDADQAIAEARVATAQQGAVSSPDQEQRLVAGAMAHTALAPGMAPWVGARAGIGFDSDAGVTYSGRTVRVDGRHAFVLGEKRAFALSVGGGLSGVLTRAGSSSPADPSGGGREGEIPGVDASGATGWGFDVPLLVGWRSNASLIHAWLGPRAGYERLGGELVLRIDPDPTVERHAPLGASRYYVGGLAGLSVGVGPVWIAVELGAAYQAIDGSLDVEQPGGGSTRHSAQLEGLSLTPGGAVGGRF